MRISLALGCLLVSLAGCDSPTEPAPALSADQLETSVAISAREVSRANPPDSVVVRIRVRNPLPVSVRIEQDSSRYGDGDSFTGLGVRWSFVITRVDAPGGGGSSGGLAWQEIRLGPGDWVDFTRVIRPVGGVWTGWDGQYVVYSSLQGRPLPIVSFRVRP
ncbi:MAG: hypothetical protein IT353_09130 [Gemmatimonadaceae bacterium]|nr:hypothetical protein [Gemmatimonadaceae bacterium]